MLGDILKGRSEIQPPARDGEHTKLGSLVVKGVSNGRPQKVPAKGDWFRASGIAYMCPRMTFLAMQEGVSTAEVIKAPTMFLFAIGHAYHTAFQDSLIPLVVKENGDTVLQGWWSCTTCNQLHQGEKVEWETSLKDGLGWIPRPKICKNEKCETYGEECKADGEECKNEKCGTHGEKPDPKEVTFSYVELSMRNEEYRVTGHIDGILDFAPDDEDEVFDLKTINPFVYEKMVDPWNGGKPMPNHEVQLNAYMWLVDHNGVRIKKGRIGYVVKGESSLKKAMNEWPVRPKSNYVEAIKKRLKDCIAVVDGVTTEVPDRLSLCTKKTDKRAKKCPLKKSCFKCVK